MHADDMQEELVLGARVCQTCQQPFVLVAKTDEEHLALHTRLLAAVVDQWQLPGFLVIPHPQDITQTRVVAVASGEEPRGMTQKEFGEAQEQAFLQHRCTR